MAQKTHEIGLIIKTDAKGSVQAIEATNAALKKFERQVDTSSAKSKGLDNALKQSAVAMGALVNPMGVLVSAMGAATTAGAAYVAWQANAIKDQANFAKAIGINVESLTSFAYALKDSGLSTEQVGDILKDTSEKIGEAFRYGTGEAQEAIESLGLDVDKLARMQPDQQMLAIASALEGVGTQAEKIQIMEAFGNDAILMLPILEKGTDYLLAQQEEAKILGVTLSEFDTSMISQASSDMGRLGTAISGAGNILTAELAPAFGAVSGAIVDTITKSGGLEQAIDGWGEAVINASAFALEGFDGFNKTLALVNQKYAQFISMVADANLAYEKIFGDKDEVREAAQWQIDAGLAVSKAISDRIAEQEKDRKKAFLESVENRKFEYELEAAIREQELALADEVKGKKKQTQDELKKLTEARAKAEQDLFKDFQSMSQYRISAIADEIEAQNQLEESRRQGATDAQYNADMSWFDGMDADDAAVDALKQSIEDIELSVDSIGDAWTRTGDAASEAIANMSKTFQDFAKEYEAAGKDQQKIDEARFALEEKYQSTVMDFSDYKEQSAKLDQKQSELKEQSLDNQLNLYASIASGIRRASEEGSAAANAAEGIETGLAVVQGVRAVIRAWGDPFPLNLVSVPLTIASVGSLLSSIGASAPLGSPTMAQFDAGQVQAAQGTGTVLGDPTAKSESINNSLELLNEINAEQYAELRSIDRGVGQLVESFEGIARNIVSAGYGNFSADTLGIYQGTIDAGGLVGALDDFISSVPLVGDLLGGIASGIFGGSVSKTLTDSGIDLASANLGEVIANQTIDGFTYGVVKSVKDGGWFGSDKTSYSTQFEDLDTSVENAFGQTFAYVGDLIVDTADQLGLDVFSQIQNYTFDLEKISLKDLTAEEQIAEINNVISAEMDRIADTMLGAITNSFQRIGEGDFETAIRLLADKAVVEDIFSMTAQAVGTTQVLADGLFSEGGLFGGILRLANGDYELKTVSANIFEVSQALVELAGSAEELRDAARDYFSEFFTEEEQFAKLTQDLHDQFTTINSVLPETREGYRALVEAQNLGIEADRERYVTLLQLSDMADQYYDNLEESAEQAAQAALELAEAEKELAEQRAQAIEEQRQTIQASLDELTQAGNFSAESIKSLSKELVYLSDVLPDDVKGATLSEYSDNLEVAIDNYMGVLFTMPDGFAELTKITTEAFNTELKIAQRSIIDTLGRNIGSRVGWQKAYDVFNDIMVGFEGLSGLELSSEIVKVASITPQLLEELNTPIEDLRLSTWQLGTSLKIASKDLDSYARKSEYLLDIYNVLDSSVTYATDGLIVFNDELRKSAEIGLIIKNASASEDLLNTFAANLDAGVDLLFNAGKQFAEEMVTGIQDVDVYTQVKDLFKSAIETVNAPVEAAKAAYENVSRSYSSLYRKIQNNQTALAITGEAILSDEELARIQEQYNSIRVSAIDYRESLAETMPMIDAITLAGERLSNIAESPTVEQGLNILEGYSEVFDGLGETVMDSLGALVGSVDSGNTSQLYNAFMSLNDLLGDSEISLEQYGVAITAIEESYQGLIQTQEELQAQGLTELRLAIDAEKAMLSGAHNLRMESLNAEYDAANTALDAILGLQSALGNAFDSIMSSTTQGLVAYSQAQAALVSVYRQAQGGFLPELADIEDYLSVVTSNDSSNYATQAEFLADQKFTANVLAGINEVAGGQLSIEEQSLAAVESQIELAEKSYEQQVAALDATLEYWQDEIDALNGVNNSVISVAQAVANLQASLTGEVVSVPAFASGGIHTGGLRLVGENGPELEFTGPSRIVSNNDTLKMLDNSELVREVQALRNEVVRLRQERKQDATRDFKELSKTRRSNEAILKLQQPAVAYTGDLA